MRSFIGDASAGRCYDSWAANRFSALCLSETGEEDVTIALSYIAAFLVTSVVCMITPAFLIPFKPIISVAKGVLPVGTFTYAFIGGFGSVWVYVTLTRNTFLELAYFMLLLPAIFQLWNDMRRVNLAKAGMSGTRRMLEQMDDLASYDQAIDIRSEQSAEAGSIEGFFAGTALFVGNAPFFS